MAININDDYSKLAKLLYPSIEATGNEYYGQARKLTTDDILGLYGNGFVSKIDSIYDDALDQYKSYFNWKLGPLSGSIEVGEFNTLGMNSVDDDIIKVPSPATIKRINKNGTETNEDLSTGVSGTIFARYIIILNDNPVAEGDYTVHEKSIACNYDKLYVTDHFDPITRSTSVKDRNFWVTSVSGVTYLYVKILSTEIEMLVNRPLTIKATEIISGPLTVTLSGIASGYTYMYKTNGGEWTAYSSSAINLSSVGDKVQFGCIHYNQYEYEWPDATVLPHFTFTGSGKIEISGNINSMLSKRHSDDPVESQPNTWHDITDDDDLSGYTQAFYKLFAGDIGGSSTLGSISEIDASQLILPCDELATMCYYCLFYYNDKLKYAPDLPATHLKYACYKSMFEGCSMLEKAPDLPAKNHSSNAYENMFKDCTSLITGPSVIQIDDGYNPEAYNFVGEMCCRSMFEGCTSLINPPLLAAAGLPGKFGSECYKKMFKNCTSLQKAPVLPLESVYFSNAYDEMFYGCTSLNEIKCNLVSYISPDGDESLSITNWLSGVSSSGTFHYNSSANWTANSTNGIPDGWTTADHDSSYFVVDVPDTPSGGSLETPYIGYSLKGAESANNYKHTSLVTTGIDSTVWNENVVTSSSHIYTMNPNNPSDELATDIDDYNRKDGSFNQDIWGWKRFNGPISFRNGIYGETGSIIAKTTPAPSSSQVTSFSLYSNGGDAVSPEIQLSYPSSSTSLVEIVSNEVKLTADNVTVNGKDITRGGDPETTFDADDSLPTYPDVGATILAQATAYSGIPDVRYPGSETSGWEYLGFPLVTDVTVESMGGYPDPVGEMYIPDVEYYIMYYSSEVSAYGGRCFYCQDPRFGSGNKYTNNPRSISLDPPGGGDSPQWPSTDWGAHADYEETDTYDYTTNPSIWVKVGTFRRSSNNGSNKYYTNIKYIGD